MKKMHLTSSLHQFGYLLSLLPVKFVLAQLTVFGLAVDEITRNNLYVREVLGLYIFILQSLVLLDSRECK